MSEIYWMDDCQAANHLSLLKINIVFTFWFIASAELSVGICGSPVGGEIVHNLNDVLPVNGFTFFHEFFVNPSFD